MRLYGLACIYIHLIKQHWKPIRFCFVYALLYTQCHVHEDDRLALKQEVDGVHAGLYMCACVG